MNVNKQLKLEMKYKQRAEHFNYNVNKQLKLEMKYKQTAEHYNKV